MGKTAMVAV